MPEKSEVEDLSSVTFTPHKKHLQKAFPGNAPLLYPLLYFVNYSD